MQINVFSYGFNYLRRILFNLEQYESDFCQTL